THTHPDHVAGLDEAAAATGALVRCHPLEVDAARALAPRVQPAADGEAVTIGRGEARALHTPGHTPGCISWHLPDPGAILPGDTLYVGSCGSVGDPTAMWHSLQQVLAALPEETRLYPGHDYGPTPRSTLAWELLHNPALSSPSLDAFCRWKRIKNPGPR
ncbi:MAG TPA: MBL fold metallo-hydrolase, partial [Kofleriaceae bacterium]|nr:MBL fold metallo-hydrolase [Kofleriaceae bacterium]